MNEEIKQFTNPYPTVGNYNPVTHARLCADMPKAPYQFLQSINPQRGAMQTTVNLLVEKLTTALKQNGITDITRIEDAKHFIANCTISCASARPAEQPTVPERPASSTLPQAGAPNDGRGTAGTPNKDKKPASKPTRVAGSVKRGSGTGGQQRVVKQG